MRVWWANTHWGSCLGSR